MDYAVLPPELNSARMYSGPGSGPILAAAAAWNGLAGDLGLAASAYSAVVAGLTTGPWLGPASASMATAAAPYALWMNAAADLAEQTGIQAKDAAVAFESAFAMTVPPPLIAANRSLLMTLVATNIFGQNTAAIAATEAQYMEMWAQDAAAMYGYAGQSAAASTLTPFTAAPNTTNPAGLLGQAAGFAQSGAVDAPTVMSAVPQALESLATPAATVSPLDLLPLLAIPAATVSSVAIAGSSTSAPASFTSVGFTSEAILMNRKAIAINADRDFAEGKGPFTGDGPGAALLPQWLGGQGEPSTVAASPVTAGMGQGAVVGGLSVPPGWATAAPEIRTVARALPMASATTDPPLLTGVSGNLFSDMALAGLAGRAAAGNVGLSCRERAVVVNKRTESPWGSLDSPITRSSIQLLRELADLHDSGVLTDDEFTEQKRRLLCH
jgi:PPE-repeat protein